ALNDVSHLSCWGLRQGPGCTEKIRAGCKISSPAGGRERGRPAGRGAVGRDQCFSGEHPVGLFADSTRLELILQRTLNLFARRALCGCLLDGVYLALGRIGGARCATLKGYASYDCRIQRPPPRASTCERTRPLLCARIARARVPQSEAEADVEREARHAA